MCREKSLSGVFFLPSTPLQSIFSLLRGSGTPNGRFQTERNLRCSAHRVFERCCPLAAVTCECVCVYVRAPVRECSDHARSLIVHAATLDTSAGSVTLARWTRTHTHTHIKKKRLRGERRRCDSDAVAPVRLCLVDRDWRDWRRWRREKRGWTQPRATQSMSRRGYFPHGRRCLTGIEGSRRSPVVCFAQPLCLIRRACVRSYVGH